jgi:hypothetical protein
MLFNFLLSFHDICKNLDPETLLTYTVPFQIAISALQSVLQEDFKATEIEVSCLFRDIHLTSQFL